MIPPTIAPVWSECLLEEAREDVDLLCALADVSTPVALLPGPPRSVGYCVLGVGWISGGVVSDDSDAASGVVDTE